MKALRSLLPVAVAIALALPLAVRGEGASSQPPVAAKQPKVTTIHGYTRTGDYHWMRERDHPAVQLASRRRCPCLPRLRASGQGRTRCSIAR